jgi:hypothetical protein
LVTARENPEVAQRMMNYLVDLGYHILPEQLPHWMRKAFNIPMRAAIIATMPRGMRLLGGIPQNRGADVGGPPAGTPLPEADREQPAPGDQSPESDDAPHHADRRPHAAGHPGEERRHLHPR